LVSRGVPRLDDRRMPNTIPWRPDQQDALVDADCTQADALLEAHGEGAILLAAKGYYSDAIRAKAKESKAWANLPPKATFAFSAWGYPPAKLRGTLILPLQTLLRHRHTVRQQPGELSHSRQTHLHPQLVPKIVRRTAEPTIREFISRFILRGSLAYS